jgi:hypothetical protein
MREFWLRILRVINHWRKLGGDVVDVFRPVGWVEFTLTHAKGPKKGQVARVIGGRNVVTSWLSVGGATPTSGRDLIRRKLVNPTFAGGLAADANTAISFFALGSDGTIEQASDTGLVDPLAGTEKPVTAVDFDPSNPYVTFTVEYDETEANGTIAEVVILSGRGSTGNRDTFARKTVGAFVKDEDFGLIVRYTVRL